MTFLNTIPWTLKYQQVTTEMCYRIGNLGLIFNVDIGYMSKCKYKPHPIIKPAQFATGWQ